MAESLLLDSAAWIAAVERSTDFETLRDTVRVHARPLGSSSVGRAGNDDIVDQLFWLEDFLKSYDGALLMTSHDREFMNRIVGKVVEIDAGSLTIYSGSGNCRYAR